MGAQAFEHVSKTEGSIDDAFAAAKDDARYDHGHAGYTGTIAEKDGYVIIESKVMGDDEASALAYKLIDEDDPRIADKWGPAGAIAVEGGWLFFGWASS